MDKHFGKYIRAKRLAMGYNLDQFATLSGISLGYLSLIERGKRNPPKTEKINVIADLLGVRRDNLLYLAKRLPNDVQIVIDSQPKAVTELIRKHMEAGLF